MRRQLFLLFTILFVIISSSLQAQNREIENQREDIISKFLDRQSGFGIYHDNFFITGIPIDREINKHTADIKFQLSVRQRLLNRFLPFGTFLMATYTQKSFWNFYARSRPFADNNYNPGLTIAKPIIVQNQLKGMMLFALEHESNGRDGIDSRGSNYVVLTGVYFFNKRLSAQAKLWAGWLSNENKNLYTYRGYGSIVLNYRSLNNRFWASVLINPRQRIGDANTQIELSFKLRKKSNHYLFLQWYNGYGESLLDYNRYTSMLRLGICIKSPFRNLY